MYANYPSPYSAGTLQTRKIEIMKLIEIKVSKTIKITTKKI